MNLPMTNRRQFLAYSFSAGALMIAAPLAIHARSVDVTEGDDELSPLITIHKDNRITFCSPSPDMGQGVDTSLAMLFIEELGGDFDLVDMKPLPVLLTRNEQGEVAWKSAPQGAGGSTSISRNWPILRNAGATARQLLLQAASVKSGQPIESLKVSNSTISWANGSLTFGELAEAAAAEQLPEDFQPVLKDRKEWKVIGKAKKHNVSKAIVTGKPLYTMDMDYPGVKTAVMVRSPWLDGDVVGVDDTAARALPGVHDVVTLPRPDMNGNYTHLAAGVVVIADDFWTAKKARDLLEIEWDRGPHTGESTGSLDEQCQDLLKETGQIVRDDGDFEGALSSSSKVFRRTYRLPTVSHAQLEPQNCIAHVMEDRAVVIGPMQGPSAATRIVNALTGLDRLKVEAHYPRLGGGFGRRLTSDHVHEAVRISIASGLPIKLIWTREDDLANDFYRPMAWHEMVAGMDDDGNLQAWSHRYAGRPKYYRRDNVKPEEMFGADIYVDDFPANLVDNLRLEYSMAKSGLPQGSWRAPAHTANAFVVQSFLDEIAAELGEDPLDLRLRLLGEPQELTYGQHGGPVYDTGRMANVLREAARLADWGRDMPDGQALGLAGHFTFGGYCALVAHVELEGENGFHVRKVFGAIDVGTVINPAGVIAQMEGGINDGLSTALGQEIRVEGGQVLTNNFDTYPMMRIGESVPEIDVHIVDSEKDPAGMGEMSIPPLAPAVMNAVVRAGGKRLRQQPFFPQT